MQQRLANLLYFSTLLNAYTYYCAQCVTRCIWYLDYHLHVILREHYYYLIAHNIINVNNISEALSLLSSLQLMIDITVLTLIGSNTPSLSDSSHVKRSGAVIDSLCTLTESRQKILQESLWDLLQSIGASLDNSGGVYTLSCDVCSTLSS